MKEEPEGDCMKAALEGLKAGFGKSKTKPGHIEALLKEEGYLTN